MKYNKQELQAALQGPVPSVSTPFDRKGEIDYPALRRMINFYIDAGMKTIMLTAGDSHYFILSEREIAELTMATAEITAGRAMLIAADFCYGTAKAVEFAEYVKKIGADMLMVMPPHWGNSATPESFVEHYLIISKHIPLMIVTNVFIPRGADFGLKTLDAVLRKDSNVVAVKDDMGNNFAHDLAV
ncbi:MAG: dihydrodipicolinate synthase family protein, partial [Victivallaceae bacterium]|nr:dihydrodipicolinate synthase family protein [Victivallaceae bacterium]